MLALPVFSNINKIIPSINRKRNKVLEATKGMINVGNVRNA
jgi:hypothetical protein